MHFMLSRIYRDHPENNSSLSSCPSNCPHVPCPSYPFCPPILVPYHHLPFRDCAPPMVRLHRHRCRSPWHAFLDWMLCRWYPPLQLPQQRQLPRGVAQLGRCAAQAGRRCTHVPQLRGQCSRCLAPLKTSSLIRAPAPIEMLSASSCSLGQQGKCQVRACISIDVFCWNRLIGCSGQFTAVKQCKLAAQYIIQNIPSFFERNSFSCYCHTGTWY